jgi:hypothetical protein
VPEHAGVISHDPHVFASGRRHRATAADADESEGQRLSDGTRLGVHRRGIGLEADNGEPGTEHLVEWPRLSIDQHDVRLRKRLSLAGQPSSSSSHETAAILRWRLPAAIDRPALDRRYTQDAGQRRVADGGEPRASRLNHQAEDDGERDQLDDVRAPPGFVRVEQRRRGDTLDGGGNLPREVVCVSEAGAEPLSCERRRQVGGVSQEEGASVVSSVGDAGMERVDGGSHDVGFMRVGERGEQPAHDLGVLHLVWTLVGQQHELPPLPTVWQGRRDSGPDRVADELERTRRRTGGTLGIDDEPTASRRDPAQADAQRVADGAAGAVACQQPGGVQLAVGAIAVVVQRERDAVGALLEAVKLVAEQQRDKRVAAEFLVQRALEVGLVKECERGMPVQRQARRQVDERISVSRAEPDRLLREQPWHSVSRQTRRLEDAQRLVIEGYGARQREDVDLALDGDGRDAGARKQERQNRPDRAESDDGDRLRHPPLRAVPGG